MGSSTGSASRLPSSSSSEVVGDDPSHVHRPGATSCHPCTPAASSRALATSAAAAAANGDDAAPCVGPDNAGDDSADQGVDARDDGDSDSDGDCDGDCAAEAGVVLLVVVRVTVRDTGAADDGEVAVLEEESKVGAANAAWLWVCRRGWACRPPR